MTRPQIHLALFLCHGLKTMTVIHHSWSKGIATGAAELAKRKGLQPLLVEEYPAATTDFTPILTRVSAANPDLLGAAGFFEDSVAVARPLKGPSVNPRMFAGTAGVDLPRFYAALGRGRGVRARRDPRPGS
jgi:ABC-type branched-subunit amino acid transport system substrate-binding protein